MSIGAPKAVLIAENLTRNCVVAGKICLADDSATRRRGLLDVKELDADSGLWLNPCEAVHTFGMKIALDVVFLDAELRVRKISAHLKPNRIAFCLSAQSALEIRAGVAASSGLNRGDQLVLRKTGTPTASAGIRRRVI
jgi:uncharacterized membrane protein (UPF0127 family)